jgi:outer membrane protein OmpA-like peptidoglycan-associated protein
VTHCGRQEGIEKNRLIAKGFGSSVPIASNNTPEGKAQNRRVEMKLVE